MALAACALAHAGQGRATFTVSVTITGPDLPVSRQPLWPRARVLREDADGRFLLVTGTPAQARAWAR